MPKTTTAHTELAAIRQERTEQFEMLAAFVRLQRPDSIINRRIRRRWVLRALGDEAQRDTDR